MNSHHPFILTWRRLCADRVAVFSLCIVSAYLLVIFASSSGLIAADWDDEIAINYAAPTFLGAQKALVNINRTPAATPENPRDPLNNIIKQLNAQISAEGITTQIERRNSLLFGADKWGRDILKKTIKGAETSIIVGLVAALLATVLGTLFGALAGYFGGRIDDVFNWFYSVFTSIPYLLLMAVSIIKCNRG